MTGMQDGPHSPSNETPPEEVEVTLGDGVELTLGQGAGAQESKRFIYN